MRKRIREGFEEHGDVLRDSLADESFTECVEEIAVMIAECYEKGGKTIWMGNGGSAAQAQHIAAEFVGKYLMDRPALNSHALNVNTSIITAVANDYAYADIFSRQMNNLVDEGDVVVGLSTSGNSENVLQAIEEAKKLKALTVGFTGKSGGSLKDIADTVLLVPSDSTPRIQEMHILAGHMICELVEEALFGG